MSETDLIIFETTVQKEGKFTFIAIPFSPRETWGARPRYYVAGAINGFAVRGCLGALGQDYFLRLSKTWQSESGITPGDKVKVSLSLDNR